MITTNKTNLKYRQYYAHTNRTVTLNPGDINILIIPLRLRNF